MADSGKASETNSSPGSNGGGNSSEGNRLSRENRKGKIGRSLSSLSGDSSCLLTSPSTITEPGVFHVNRKAETKEKPNSNDNGVQSLGSRMSKENRKGKIGRSLSSLSGDGSCLSTSPSTITEPGIVHVHRKAGMKKIPNSNDSDAQSLGSRMSKENQKAKIGRNLSGLSGDGSCLSNSPSTITEPGIIRVNRKAGMKKIPNSNDSGVQSLGSRMGKGNQKAKIGRSLSSLSGDGSCLSTSPSTVTEPGIIHVNRKAGMKRPPNSNDSDAQSLDTRMSEENSQSIERDPGRKDLIGVASIQDNTSEPGMFQAHDDRAASAVAQKASSQAYTLSDDNRARRENHKVMLARNKSEENELKPAAYVEDDSVKASAEQADANAKAKGGRRTLDELENYYIADYSNNGDSKRLAEESEFEGGITQRDGIHIEDALVERAPKEEHVDEDNSEGFLIEATVVQEVDLVMAEPIRASMYQNAAADILEDEYDEEDGKGVGYCRRCVCGAAIIVAFLILGVGVTAGILFGLRSDNSDKSTGADAVTNGTSALPEANTSVPSKQPSLRPSLSPTVKPIASNIFSRDNSSTPLTFAPSGHPSLHPSPSGHPSLQPFPSGHPSLQPSLRGHPSLQPSTREHPSLQPSSIVNQTQQPSSDLSANTSLRNATIPPTTNPYSWMNSDYLPIYTLKAIAESSNSPQARGHEWLKQHPDFSTMPDWRKRQLVALGAIFYATAGKDLDKWPADFHWLNASVHECQWKADYNFQPACDGNGTYQDLDLGGDGLQGKFPPEIALLTSLHSITMRSNYLEGPIPTQMGTMAILEFLSFGGNRLTGTIPTQFGQMSSLTALTLRENLLTSTIPSDLGRLIALRDLQLYGNKLTGPIPDFPNLTTLSLLTLFNNQLTGPIPSSFAQLTSLEILGLYNNTLGGSLPESLGSMTALKSLALWSNQFNGSIPSFVANLTNLGNLELNRNAMVGPLSESLGALTALTTLSLADNQFTGIIPSAVTNLTQLALVYLDNNLLEGPLPEALGAMPALTHLSLWGNQFTGTIPSTLLTKIGILELHNNSLDGPLPEVLGNSTWSFVTNLSVSDNKLTGTIPSSWAKMTKLVRLELNGNLLGGPLPDSLGAMTALAYLSLSDNQFSGSISSALANLTSLEHLELHNTSLTGSIPASVCTKGAWVSLDCNRVKCHYTCRCSCNP